MFPGKFRRKEDAMREMEKAPAIQNLNVNSVVTNIMDNQTIPPGEFTLKGYAYGTAGGRIVRVDISLDKGKSWLPATLHHPGLRYDNS